jgi:phospholipid/cholesterol/gamma-HCH transport system substrate-binding protein
VRPVGANARRLLESFQRTGGINRAMDYIFYQVAAINGFDSFGHYLRAGLIVNQCANYTTEPVFGCSANFPQSASGAAAAAAASRPSGKPRDPVLQRTAAVLARALGLPGAEDAPETEATTQRTPAATSEPEPAAVQPAPAEAPAPPSTPTPAPSQTDALLDYLFGGEG